MSDIVEELLLAGELVRRYEINQVETGRRARALRQKRGLSLREVARRMKVSAPFLSDLERGRRNWNVETKRRFNAALTAGGQKGGE